MFKKAGAVAAAAAGLMLLGSPAFATPHGDYDDGSHYTAIGELNSDYDYDQYFEDGEDGDYADQFGLINFNDDSDLLSNLNVCQLEIIPIIPILSENDETYCINSDNDDNSYDEHEINQNDDDEHHGK